ncbi:isoprenylcysteine carboxylmethyltransferase family protein [Phanerochaete sordida]|uniref:Protein-S-isoprenylcysteine O-methyltransferase n=1 Tax=Phanerochaete sordida TaxID=48140 RepID=A0A9P3LHS6_9APHY|nr:isoprenylcysteine carboxylmethyltransferase family protein [Phanerochaete sordida]
MMWLPVSQVIASPLAKVPLLLTATRLAALAMTPPTPRTSAEEQRAYKAKADPAGPLSARPEHVGAISRVVLYAMALCESATILAKYYPSAMPNAVLLHLVRDSLRASHSVRITPCSLAGCLAMAAGGALRLACYRTMGRLFTWELSVKKDHTLVTSGPYAVVRHPSYTGNVLIGIGAILCHFGPGSWYAECVGWETWGGRAFAALWGAWMLAIPAMLCSRVSAEDEILHEEFGFEWEQYAKRTPYRLIPYVY